VGVGRTKKKGEPISRQGEIVDEVVDRAVTFPLRAAVLGPELAPKLAAAAQFVGRKAVLGAKQSALLALEVGERAARLSGVGVSWQERIEQRHWDHLRIVETEMHRRARVLQADQELAATLTYEWVRTAQRAEADGGPHPDKTPPQFINDARNLLWNNHVPAPQVQDVIQKVEDWLASPAVLGAADNRQTE